MYDEEILFFSNDLFSHDDLLIKCSVLANHENQQVSYIVDVLKDQLKMNLLSQMFHSLAHLVKDEQHYLQLLEHLFHHQLKHNHQWRFHLLLNVLESVHHILHNDHK